MKKLLALGILATALPLVMQQNVSGKDNTSSFNDSIEQNPDLCALGYETFEGSTVLCEQYDFTQIGTNGKYPVGGKYVLGKDIAMSGYTTHDIVFTGTIDGRGKAITFANNRIDPIGDATVGYKVGLFAAAGANATFKNLKIEAKTRWSYTGSRPNYMMVGALASRVDLVDGNITVDNVDVTMNFRNAEKSSKYYGGLFGYMMLGTIDSKSSPKFSVKNSKVVSTGMLDYTVEVHSDSQYMGGIVGYINSNGKDGNAGQLEVLNNTITTDHTATETVNNVYSAGISGIYHASNGASAQVSGNAIKHVDNLGGLSDLGSTSYYSGSLFGRANPSSGATIAYQNNKLNGEIVTTRLNRIDAGGVIGYINAQDNSTVNSKENIIDFKATVNAVTQHARVGGMYGTSVTNASTNTNLNTFVNTTINLNGNVTLGRAAGLIAHDNTLGTGRTNFDGLVVIGTVVNTAWNEIYLGGITSFFETDGGKTKFANTLVANSISSTSGGQSTYEVGDIFGKTTSNSSIQENAYFVTNKASSQFAVVTKDEVTFEFLTNKWVPTRLVVKGMNLNVDVWQIQPEAKFFDETGSPKLFFRVDSRAQESISANDPSQDNVFGLEEIFIPKTINWWFLLVIAGVLGFTFWLYMWNKNRKRYN